MAPLNLTIELRKKKRTADITVGSEAKISAVKLEVEKAFGLYRHRQGLKLNGADGKDVRLTDDSKTLSSYGVKSGDVVSVSDYGPQFSYRGVFFWEYFGPIAIMALYYSRPSFLYGEGASSVAFSPIANLGVMCWVAHFVKREFETFFVHRFSRPTMPLSNLFKNSIYYWGFALAVGYSLCSPSYQAPTNGVLINVGLALFVVSELVNAAVHLQFRNMRPAEGSQVRPAPTGILFTLVSCPNYTAEVLCWVGFSLMTQVGWSYVFTVIGLAQMSQWALGKHNGYKKNDPSYKRLGRKAIIPFVL